MFSFSPITSWILLKTATLAVLVASWQNAVAFDLFGKSFKKDIVVEIVWELNEQHVSVVKIENEARLNQHPVELSSEELKDALSSLRVLNEAGFFSEEKVTSLYTAGQPGLIADYVSQALSKAQPNEEVVFTIRGYSDVLLGVAREREWTTGRLFFVDNRLNLIVGEYRKRLDKGKKNVEGAFGLTEDLRDVFFQSASRNHQGKLEGRIITTEGVRGTVAGTGRPGWVTLDIEEAARAYRESQIPEQQRKAEKRAEAQTAKLTLERRKMLEEMARMRKDLQKLQENDSSNGETLADRLTKLRELLNKGLISESDFDDRKTEILNEI